MSDDPNTQNGAVLVTSEGIAVDCNRLPKGCMRTLERTTAPLKYSWMAHAESGAILRASGNGWATAGTTLVCPYAACVECAKTMIAAGVTVLIRHKQCMDRTPQRWKQSISLVDTMLKEAGVRILDFDTSFVGEYQLFDGEVWHP